MAAIELYHQRATRPSVILMMADDLGWSDVGFNGSKVAKTPHLPVVTGSVYREMYADLPLREQLYYGCITAMDDQVGRLRELLASLDFVPRFGGRIRHRSLIHAWSRQA